ncbi:hypothetical protein C0J52_13910 [Blattella germanica]|nr:hypothetical protein C0J52_13910 [Blattella germanica]
MSFHFIDNTCRVHVLIPKTMRKTKLMIWQGVVRFLDHAIPPSVFGLWSELVTCYL